MRAILSTKKYNASFSANKLPAARKKFQKC